MLVGGICIGSLEAPCRFFGVVVLCVVWRMDPMGEGSQIGMGDRVAAEEFLIPKNSD